MLKKSLSQHLIKDKNILNKMVRLTGINRDDIVVEIGAGQGDLTRCLCEKAGFVHAVEIDGSFRRYLEALKEDYGNLNVIICDFLDFDLKFIERDNIDRKIKVIGNIPYKITAPIIFKLIDAKQLIDSAYLTVQKEIGERITSRPHKKTYGALSVICQLLSDAHILLRLNTSIFVPPPRVDSVFISMTFKKDDKITDGLIKFVRICFENKRKYMRNALIRHYDPEKISVLYNALRLHENTRAEEIEPERFLDIYRFLHG